MPPRTVGGIKWSVFQRAGELMRGIKLVFLVCCLILAGSAHGSERFTINLDDDDWLEVDVVGGGGDGPLFIWLVNQYRELETPGQVIEQLAQQGATVWRVDLLESLLLQRTSRIVRELSGTPVAALLANAVDATAGNRPVVIVACDRMTAPALRGLRVWQETATNLRAVAGAILLFPNLHRGAPIAGESPELLGIVDATNMPVAILQPALGSGRERLPTLVRGLQRAGSPVYTQLVPAVGDYYLLYSESGRNRALEGVQGVLPPALRAAIDATPHQLMTLTRLLDRSPRPPFPLPLDRVRDRPLDPVFGLIPRPALPQRGYQLQDINGRWHRAEENLGRVTLINFWASWCPPCVHEIPSMNRLAASYSEKEFAIVSINFREDPQHIRDFMRRVEVDFPVLMDHDGRVSREWGVFAFPSSFIVDRNGAVRYSVNAAIEWDMDAVREVIDHLRHPTTQ